MGIEILKDILMKNNILDSIRLNMNKLTLLIPEINSMVDFPHNNPYHHLDVWKHTLLSLSLSPIDFDIRIVLLLHDIGKPYSFQDEKIRHFKDHQIVSSQMSENILLRLNFSIEKIKELCYLIREHDNRISDTDIKENKSLAFKRFQIQVCDTLAHNPEMLEKRIKYLLKINEELNDLQIKNYYEKLINDFYENKYSKKYTLKY